MQVASLSAWSVIYHPHISPEYLCIASSNHSNTKATKKRWLSKLLGYDFNIIYKPCVQNKPADVLSLLLGASFQTLSVVSQPIAVIWDALRRGQQSHPTTTLLISAVTANPAKHPSYSIYYGLLF